MALTLVTTSEIKTIINEQTTDFDTAIGNLIPYVTRDLCEYLNNYFEDGLIYYDAGELSFVPDSTGDDTITDNQSGFTTKGFTTAMDVRIQGAYANDDLYHLDGVAAGTLTLDTAGDLTSYAYDDGDHALGIVRISKVNWPKALKLVAAKMVAYLLHNPEPDDIQSQTIDGATTVFAGSHAYPRRILAMADKWRRPRFV